MVKIRLFNSHITPYLPLDFQNIKSTFMMLNIVPMGFSHLQLKIDDYLGRIHQEMVEIALVGSLLQ
jgi:hypothetical protein